jgi:hypothetical protein
MMAELGNWKFVSGSSRVVPMVVVGVTFVAEEMGIQLVCQGVGKVWLHRRIFLP